MNKTMLYTAVGYLAMKQGPEGQPYPVVVLNCREHMMAPVDLLLWSRLCWRFRDHAHLQQEYETAVREVPGAEELGKPQVFEDTLDRLIHRGLIAVGEGENPVDTLYDLISDLYVAPLDNSFGSRLALLSKLFVSRRATCAIVGNLMRKDRTTEEESRILHLARQALLSTAELIKCDERGIQDISSSDRLLGALYYDDETTCYNISHLMRQSPRRDAVVLAVSNLFLRKQIVFQRTCL